MKISKDEVLALIEGIERATMDAPIPDALRALRERAQTPDGPYKVGKAGRDQRGHRVWALVTTSTDPLHNIDLFDDGRYDRWYYSKQDALEAADTVNRLIAEGARSSYVVVAHAPSATPVEPTKYLCTDLWCTYQTSDHEASLAHGDRSHPDNEDHTTVVNAQWKKWNKQQNPDQRLL